MIATDSDARAGMASASAEGGSDSPGPEEEPEEVAVEVLPRKIGGGSEIEFSSPRRKSPIAMYHTPSPIAAKNSAGIRNA